MTYCLDAHCHLFDYPDADNLIGQIARNKMLVLAMTNAPSQFGSLQSRMGRISHVRLALGAHPLWVAQFREVEWTLFKRYIPLTSYVGEVGLDFSADGKQTRVAQEQAFRRVLGIVRGHHKLLSVHSRRAEARVLELLNEHEVKPVVFHWYTGTTAVLDEIVAQGHFFSINPAMVAGAFGRALISRMPLDRVLTETDGPNGRYRGRSLVPTDVLSAYRYLEATWQMPEEMVRARVQSNFASLLHASVQ
jgi:TatD DNase family protein